MTDQNESLYDMTEMEDGVDGIEIEETTSELDIPFDLEESQLPEDMSEERSDDCIVLDKEKFDVFLNVLGIIRKNCKDVSIKGGQLCQSSNGRNVLYNADLTELIGDIDLNLSGLDSKCDLFDIFRKQQSEEVYVEIEPKIYKIGDTISSILINKPNEETLNNKNRSTDNPFNEEDISKNLTKVFDVKIGQLILNRFGSLKKSMASDNIILDFTQKGCILSLKQNDKNCGVVVNVHKITDIKQPIIGKTIINIDCFLHSYGDVNFELYADEKTTEDGTMKCRYKISFKVGPKPEIQITIWGAAKIITNDDLE